MIRTSYWSSSKFASWIRGEEKSFALEWGEWDKYYDDEDTEKLIKLIKIRHSLWT